MAMNISTEGVDGIAILRPQGDIDRPAAAELDEMMAGAADDGARHFVIDLSGVNHVGSDGLKAILGALKRVREQGGTMAFAAIPSEVRALLSAGGFLSLLQEFDDAGSAANQIRANGGQHDAH